METFFCPDCEVDITVVEEELGEVRCPYCEQIIHTEGTSKQKTGSDDPTSEPSVPESDRDREPADASFESTPDRPSEGPADSGSVARASEIGKSSRGSGGTERENLAAITILGVLTLLMGSGMTFCGGGSIATGGAMLTSMQNVENPEAISGFTIAIGIMVLLIGLGVIGVGLGLLYRKNWARILTLIFGFLILGLTLPLLLTSPLMPMNLCGLIFPIGYGSMVLYILLSDPWKQAFT